MSVFLTMVYYGVERFSIEHCKTKTKVNTLANHKGCGLSNEPIKTRSKYMKLMPPPGGGVLPIMAYTGRLRPKGVPFSGFRYIKGWGFHELRYIKG